MSEVEDRRNAVNIKISLANSLISVALAFIGAEGLIAVFILDKRDHLLWFYLIAAFAVIMLTYSVVFGGLGIRNAYKDGFKGNWVLSDQGKFSNQSICCLLGAALVLASSVLGTPKPGAQRVDVRLIQSDSVIETQHQVDKLRADLEQVKKELVMLRNAPSQRSDKKQKLGERSEKQ